MSTQLPSNPVQTGANHHLAGKVALVTGASRGIGAMTARLFAQEGAKLVLAARSQEAVAHLAEEIKAGGGEALAVKADVSDAASVEFLIKRVVEAYGRLDLAVNNAGMAGGNKPLIEMSEETFDQVTVYSKRSVRASSWVAKLAREVHSRLRVPKNRSITALSQQLPLRLMLTRMPWSCRNV